MRYLEVNPLLSDGGHCSLTQHQQSSHIEWNGMRVPFALGTIYRKQYGSLERQTKRLLA
jgi:hypothetical protein